MLRLISLIDVDLRLYAEMASTVFSSTRPYLTVQRHHAQHSTTSHYVDQEMPLGQ